MGGRSERQPRKRVGGDSIAFFFIIYGFIVTRARAAYVSLDLPNSYRYPRAMTVVANVLSRLESTTQKKGTLGQY